MKKEYLQYLLLLISKMTPDAMIVIDDVVKFRDKMEDLYDFLDRNHIEYKICSTDPDDGIMILSKQSLI
jgi:predicted O-methyltransferase YrrM